MSYGVLSATGERWGFSSAEDWLMSVILSFPLPWSVGPLTGKYYGTEILDARGIAILSFWSPIGEPSARMKESFPDDSPETLQDYLVDDHWESEASLGTAELVVVLANRSGDLDCENLLAWLVLKEGRWTDAVAGQLACGGPNRRRPEGPPLTAGPAGRAAG